MLAKLDNHEFPGPRWEDWVASFGATMLIALEINSRGARDLVQSGLAYYFTVPGVQAVHNIALALNIAFLFSTSIWLVTKHKRVASGAMILIAFVAVALCWWELTSAIKAQEGAVFILPNLPFRPMNNLGVVGAQLFGSYLIFKLPHMNLKPVAAFLIKTGLCVCLWVLQAIIWQLIAVPH